LMPVDACDLLSQLITLLLLCVAIKMRLGSIANIISLSLSPLRFFLFYESLLYGCSVLFFCFFFVLFFVSLQSWPSSPGRAHKVVECLR
jgi:hypothetical protein